MTVSSGLRGRPNPDSQANGAMMRISPLGIFGANHALNQITEWAIQNANYIRISLLSTVCWSNRHMCIIDAGYRALYFKRDVE